MEIGFDWTAIKEAGVIGLSVVLIIVGFQAFKIIVAQWKSSTDAVNKNTEAFTELSRVFERSHERELEFHAEMRERVKDTQKKVREIHDKIV